MRMATWRPAAQPTEDELRLIDELDPKGLRYREVAA